MLKKKGLIFLAFSLLMVLITGCGSSTVENAASHEPITLTVYPWWCNLSEQQFNDEIKKPVEEKFPYITMQLASTGTGNSPADSLQKGDFADIVFTANSQAWVFTDLGIPADLSSLIKKYKVDLAKFDSTDVDFIKKLGKNGEMLGIPGYQNQFVLMYNKDIFDKFGVPYPKDGMTWDDTLNLAKSLTRTSDGVQYVGLETTSIDYLARQRGLQYIDPDTHKSNINNDDMKKILQLYQDFYQIPGYPNQKHDEGFFKARVNAMTLAWTNDTINTLSNLGSPMNWDMVSEPAFKDRPGVSMDPGATMFMVSKTSKYQEEAFQVLNFLTSVQEQTLLSENGKVTSLNNPVIQQEYGGNIDVMKGKNIKGVMSLKPALLGKPTKYDGIVKSQFNDMQNKIAQGGQDINTIMIQEQDAADKAIAEAVQANQ